jgi:hypothetical protein
VDQKLTAMSTDSDFIKPDNPHCLQDLFIEQSIAIYIELVIPVDLQVSINI